MLYLMLTQILNAQTQKMSKLSDAYFGITNALVADDGLSAASKADSFVKHLNAYSTKGLKASQLKVWNANLSKMKTAADLMSKSTEVAKQREQLNALSTSFFAVLKGLKANDGIVYYQYCPMKKTYWISKDKAIRNPYYGKKMLACGNIVETLK